MGFFEIESQKLFAQGWQNLDPPYLASQIAIITGVNAFLTWQNQARSQWLIPVILANEEAEMRRIAVRSQPCANSLQDPNSKKTRHRKGLVEWLKV
jgi:hypothetical protein